jgi:hypothetical protein
MVVRAVPSAAADIDLYLQRLRNDGTWSGDITSGTSGSTTEETLSTNRLAPGRYRLDVHNWLGPPANNVDLTIDFFNQANEKGPDG